MNCTETRELLSQRSNSTEEMASPTGTPISVCRGGRAKGFRRRLTQIAKRVRHRLVIAVPFPVKKLDELTKEAPGRQQVRQSGVIVVMADLGWR